MSLIKKQRYSHKKDKPLISDLLVGIIFMFFIHPFSLRGLGTISYIFIYGIPIIYLLINYNFTARFVRVVVNSHSGKILLGIFILIIWSLITMLINGSSDISFFTNVLSVFRWLIRIVPFGILAYKKSTYRDELAGDLFIHYLILANVFYVITTLILVAFLPIKNIWFSIIEQSSLYLTEQSIYRNRIAINGFAGYRETFFSSLAAIFSLYMLEKGKNRKTYILTFLICTVGNFFYGRTGLVASMIGLAIYLLQHFKLNIRQTATIILGIFVVYLGGAYLLSVNESFKSTINWATRPIIELLGTGTTTNYTFNRITRDMIFMPDFKTFIIGDAYYTDPITGHYYMRTDLGFMRLMLFGGIIACIIVYIPIMLGILRIGKGSLFFTVSLLIMFIAFEYKGDIWYTFMPVLILMEVIKFIESDSHRGVAN